LGTRVIVEGPDGGGKSTLIRRLVEHTGLRIAPRASDSAKGPLDDLTSYIDADLLHHDGISTIYDRHPLISEFVYGPAIRGHLKFTPDEILDVKWLIDRLSMFRDYNPVMIYCLPPFHTVWQNTHSRRTVQMPGVCNNIRQIYELYLVLYAQDAAAGRRVHHYDYTQSGNYFKILRDVEAG